MVKKSKPNKQTAVNLGFEAQLWQAADALRGSMCGRRNAGVFDNSSRQVKRMQGQFEHY